MKKILSILICGMLVVGMTGCGNDQLNDDSNSNESSNKEQEILNTQEDNQELVNALNNAVTELYNEAKEKNIDFSLALYNIIDKLKEQQIKQYTFTAICDKAFVEKPNITGYTSPSEKWTSSAENIEDYDGKCNYNTWVFTEYNSGKNYHVLVLDNGDYYSVMVSFKKINYNNKDRYYPTFSNSTLLK